MTANAPAAARNNTSLGAIYIMLAMLGFASMDTITKWMVVDYPVGQMMWVRYAVFCLFAWAVVRRRGLRAAARSARPGLQFGRALLAVIESAVFVLAFRYLPLADTHAVAATSPLIVIALGVLFLGERAGTARWAAVGAGFVGVLLIVRPGFRELDWPLLLPVAGAILWKLANELHKADGPTQSDLAGLLDIEQPTLVRLLDGLERNGMIERRTVEGDRRARRVFLTETARAQAQDILDFLAELRAGILQGIAPEELEAALDVLRRTSRNIAAGRSAAP